MTDSRPVAAYLRLSKSDVASTSIEKQRRNVIRKASQDYAGAEVVEFVDDGVSASKARQRPGFEELLRRVRAGDFRAVLADTQDRITRELGGAGLWDLAVACEQGGARLDGATEPIDVESGAGEFMAAQKAALARFEARRTSERVAATNRLRREQGRRALGGRVPFGLVRDGEAFRPDPTAAPVVLDAAERLAAGNVSLRGIAREWEAAGVPAPSGGTTWATRTVTRLFRNPALAGMTPSARTEGGVLAGDDGMPLVDPGQVVIPAELWERLQTALNTRQPTKPKPYQGELPLLNGLVRDDKGHRMYRYPKPGRDGQPVLYYACKANDCGRTIAGERLEAFVTSAFVQRYAAEPHGYEVVQEAGQDAERLIRIKAEVARLAAAIPSAEPTERAALMERLTKVSAAEAEERARIAEPAVRFVPSGKYLGEALSDALEAENVAEARDLLASRIDAVIVGPGRPGVALPMGDRATMRWKD